MLVADIMQRALVTVAPSTTLPEVLRLVRQRGIRHLPVVADGRLVGIVSDRDLKQALPSPATSLAANQLTYLLDQVAIAEIMTRAVIVASPRMAVEEAARRMVDEKISALPVVDGDALVGLVTETDLLRVLVRALGADQPSSRLDVELGADGSVADVVAVVSAAGAPVVSVVTLPDPRGGREAVVRIASIDPRAAVRALESRGYTLRDAVRRGIPPSGGGGGR